MLLFPCKLSYRDPDTNGYPRIMIDGKRWKLHRLTYARFHKIELTHDDVIMHLCDNPRCIEITHLKLGTTALNNLDKISKGRHNNPKGEAHHMTEMTEEKVKELRNLFDSGRYSKAELGRIYNITDVSVGHIINGRTWTHI